VERCRRARCHAGDAGGLAPANGRGHPQRGGQDDSGDIRYRYAWPRRIMDAAPVVVPGQHRPACGSVIQSQHQPCSGNSGAAYGSRKSGEVSARCGIDSRACGRYTRGVNRFAPQHVGALHRAGERLGDRRFSVCARSDLRLGLRRRSACRACGDPDEAKEGLGRVAAGRFYVCFGIPNAWPWLRKPRPERALRCWSFGQTLRGRSRPS
jgi:hypothetical protein